MQGITLIVQLGNYVGAVHTPIFPDNFPEFGLIGSQCIIPIENDIVFCGLQGITTASRSVYTQSTLNSDLASSVIEPNYRKVVGTLTETQRKISTFAFYDPLAKNVLLVIPSTAGLPAGYTFCYTNNTKLGYKAWSLWTGVRYACGCTSALGRVFLTNGTRIFQLGNEVFGERAYTDINGDYYSIWAKNTFYLLDAGLGSGVNLVRDTADNTSWQVITQHVSPNDSTITFAQDRTQRPGNWKQWIGVPIAFDMELPWLFGQDAMKVKKLRFISIGTRGNAQFTVSAYVDNLYKDKDGNVIYQPALSMVFDGNDASGYGVVGDENPFGGPRRSRDPRLWEFPMKFKSAKFKITGSTAANKTLEVQSLSFLFARGSYFR